VKVRDVLGNWPPLKWTADDPGNALRARPAAGLLWFSVPDQDGWFSLTATDPQGASWSTYCRAPSHGVWRALERTLNHSLRVPLKRIGDVDLESMTLPQSV
jgi:hypothetical protein